MFPLTTLAYEVGVLLKWEDANTEENYHILKPFKLWQVHKWEKMFD